MFLFLFFLLYSGLSDFSVFILKSFLWTFLLPRKTTDIITGRKHPELKTSLSIGDLASLHGYSKLHKFANFLFLNIFYYIFSLGVWRPSTCLKLKSSISSLKINVFILNLIWNDFCLWFDLLLWCKFCQSEILLFLI